MKKILNIFVLGLLAAFWFLPSVEVVALEQQDYVYHTDFEGITVDKNNTADNATGFIWANQWEQTKTENHNGSNMLKVAVNDKTSDNMYSTIGGFGIGMNSNLSRLTIGEAYKVETYFEFANCDHIYVEFVGGSGKWGSVLVKNDGSVVGNPGGNNISSVTYENNILTFVFTMAFNQDENVNGYIKFTAYNAVNAYLYLDDISITRALHHFENDLEYATLGVQNTTEATEFNVYYGQFYSDKSVLEVVNRNASKALKVSYTPNATEGVSAFFINKLDMLNRGREYQVKMTLETENVDQIVIYAGGVWYADETSRMIINTTSKEITIMGTNHFSNAKYLNNILEFTYVAHEKIGEYNQFQIIGESSNTSSKGIMYVDNIVFDQKPVVLELELDTTNVQKVFEYGEAFNTNNLAVYGLYSDETKSLLASDLYTVSGYDANLVGKQRILVKIANIEVSYIIEVVHTASGVSVNTNEVKTNYQHGEALDLSNLVVKAVYSDETSEEIAHDAVLNGYWLDLGGFDAYKAGTYTITIYYQSTYTTLVVVVEEMTNVDLSGITFDKM